MLDVSLIRKMFKPLFIPFLSKNLTKPIKVKSSMEIRVVFEFSEEFYKKVFETFNFISSIRKLGVKKFKPSCSQLDRGHINDIAKHCSSDLLLELFQKNQLLNINNILDIKIEIVNENIYLKGKYLKFCREIGQSPWEINGVKICNSSVEEELKRKIIDMFKCDGCILSAGGREDRDVRMLGSGRPFILEIANPRRKYAPLQNIEEIQKIINSNTHLIEAVNLGVCDRSYFAVLKKYEDSKMKSYTCLVWASKEITDEDINTINLVKDLTVIQKTPIRVMHRRTLMDRKKTIFKMDAAKINEHFLVLYYIYIR